MKTVLSLFVVFGLMAVAFGAVSREKNAVPGTCSPKQFKVGVMRAGETKAVPKKCASVKCSQKEVVFQTCGPAVPGRTGDLSKPYPKCCPVSDFLNDVHEP